MRGFTRSQKPFYLNYQGIYGLQTWQDVDLTWWTPLLITLSWSGLTRSRDKLKLLYLQYHSAHDQQNWQSGDLQ